MLQTLVLIAVWTMMATYCWLRPYGGVAIVLALGQFALPFTGEPGLPGAPLLIFVLLSSHLKVNSLVLARGLAIWICPFVLALIGATTLILQAPSSSDGFRLIVMLALYAGPLGMLGAAFVLESRRTQFYGTFVLVAAALAFITVIQASLSLTGRSTALGGGPIPLAQLFCFGAAITYLRRDVISIALPALKVDGRIARAGRFLLLGLLIVAAVLTGSRFPVISLALSFVVSWALATISHPARLPRPRSILVGAFVFFAGSAIANWVAQSSAIPIVSSRYRLLLENPGAELWRSRGELFRNSASQAYEAIPLGYGPGGLRPVIVQGEPVPFTYPHNIFIEAMGDFGLLGIIFLTWAVFVIFYRNHRAFERLPLVLSVYALLISQTSGDLVHNRFLFFFGVMLIAVHIETRYERPHGASEIGIVRTFPQ